MGDIIKGLFMIAIGLVAIMIPASCVIGCVQDCNEQDRIKGANTEIKLILDDLTYRDGMEEGDVLNYVALGFKNVSMETIHSVTCTINYYDYQGFLLGKQEFDYNPIDEEPVEYAQSTSRHVKYIITHDGVRAAYVKITNLKVNGYEKEPEFLN